MTYDFRHDGLHIVASWPLPEPLDTRNMPEPKHPRPPFDPNEGGW